MQIESNNKKNIFIEIIAKTNAKENKIERKKELFYVYVTCPPVEGKANKKIISLLANYFNVPKDCVEIIRGASFRRKIAKIYYCK